MPELPSKEEVADCLRRLLPGVQPGTSFYETGEMLVVAAMAKSYGNTWMAQATGRSRGWVIAREKRLRMAGVWMNGKVEADWMNLEMDGHDRTAGLMIDIKIAEGLIEET